MSTTQFSHSRVSTFEQCAAQFKFRYIDQLQTVHAPEADNALIVGNALHTGIENGERAMLDWYFNQFPIIGDLHVHETMKLSAMLPKVKSFLATLNGPFRHEYEIDRPDVHAFIDLIVPNPDGTVDIYDFKYSNNVDKYLQSPQLHLYKFYLEREFRTEKTPRQKFQVNRLGFIFIPKTNIRQKKDEDLYQFRRRLIKTLAEMEIRIEYVDYDFQQVKDYWQSCSKIEAAKHYPKNPSRLCDWCDYNKFCLEGDDTMILPSSERRTIGSVKRKTLWAYGAPFSGKTWFANSFPAPLMLNTDGNIDFVDAPYIPIRDEVTVEGRITKRKFAWDVFKDVIAELEKKQNEFKTIIVDLLEDCYEHCRLYMYDKLGIEHESDNSFKAWDMVRTEFLSTMRRLLNLPYDIILISHEDLTKDVTRKSGDKVTRTAPNIQEKAAKKIAGMVQLVARVVADDDERWLMFKTSEVEFGGGRLGVRARKIPLNYDEFIALYEEVNAGKSLDGKSPEKEEKPKRGRVKKEEPIEEEKSPVENVDEETEQLVNDEHDEETLSDPLPGSMVDGDSAPIKPEVEEQVTETKSRRRRRA